MATAAARPESTASSEVQIELPSAPPPEPRRPRGERLAPLLYTIPVFAVYAVFVLWPIIQVARLSLYRWDGYGPQRFIGPQNFSALAGDALFRTSLQHSILWELSALLVPTALALGLALLIRMVRARAFFLTVLLFPALLPVTVVAAIWVLVYSPLTGLLNTCLRALHLGPLAADWLGDPHLTLAALFVAWTWSVLGIGVLLLEVGLLGISREYVELAMVEGAGPIWRFLHIILPGLRRVGVMVLLINATLGAGVFDLVFVTTGGGPGYATMLIPLDMYGRAFGGYTGQGAAVALVQIVIGLIMAGLALTLFGRRHESLDTGSPPVEAGNASARTVSTGMLALVLVVVLLPLGWLALAAVEGGRSFALQTGGPGFDPRQWAWGNFATVWSAGLSTAAVNGSLLATGTVLAGLALAVPAAFALARIIKSTTWRYVAGGLLLVGLLQPTPALIIPLFALLKSLGLRDTFWGVLLPEIGRVIPFAVLVLWAYLAQSPREVLEAAQVDGASRLQEMVRIALPLARPAVYAVAVWTFLTSWNEYLLPTVVSQDGSLQTVPTVLASFIGKYDTAYGPLAAGCLIAVAPCLLIYLALRKPAAEGMTRIERTLQ